MKLKLRELKKIIKEAISEQGLDAFRKSDGFKNHLESIITALNEFSAKTPVGFFDVYRNEYETDFYKSFHDFHEGLKEVYDNLFTSGGEMHVAQKTDDVNIEQNIEESKQYGGAEPDFASWPKEKAEKYWETLKKNHKSFEDKVKAVSSFASNPESFVNALEKKATGELSNKKD